MDRSVIIVLLVLLVLVVAAILFYTNPTENQRQTAIGFCELLCINKTSGSVNYSGSCISGVNKSVYGYGCAISNSQNIQGCGSPTVYVTSKCQLVAVS